MPLSIRVAFVALLSVALAGCSPASLMHLADKEDAFARRYLDIVRTGDRARARTLLIERERAKLGDDVLDGMRALLDKPEPREITLIGLNALSRGTTSRVALIYQIHNPADYVVATVVVDIDGADEAIEGMQVAPLPDDLRRINALNLGHKGIGEYFMLLLALGVLGLMIYALVLCAKTPMRRRKWLWIVFILFGVGKLWINWTTGDVNLQPLMLQLVVVGFQRASIYGPIMIFVSFPLGAIVFLVKRRSLTRVEPAPSAPSDALR